MYSYNFSTIPFEWILLIAIAIVGMIVQWRLKSIMTKYSKVPFDAGQMTGAEVARKMLADAGITNVEVQKTGGWLSDHYNPKKHTVNLSEGVYNGRSITAAAVAAHECGHAVQHKMGYAPLRLRSAMVPAISVSSSVSTIVVIIGIITIETMPAIFWLGIGMIALAALFSIITLPVEFNASKRAVYWLRTSRLVNEVELGQASTALRWAASTYVVAALSAVVTLLYYIGFARRR